MSVASCVRMIVGTVSMLGLSGCAAFVLITMEPEQRAALFLAPADRAVIYFYPEVTRDTAAVPAIYLDGEPIGEPTTTGFWYREVHPGVHTVTLADQPAEAISLSTEAGHLYFIGEAVDCASQKAPNLRTVSEAAGRKRIRAIVAASKSPPSDAGRATLACGEAEHAPAL